MEASRLPHPAFVHAPAPAPPPTFAAGAIDLRVDVSLLAQAAVEQALVPLYAIIRELERRLAELERRPPLASGVGFATASVATAPPLPLQSLPQRPVLDVAAIERDVQLGVDIPWDGRKHRRNVVIVLTVALVVLFGVLFAALAQSYVPQ
jgi:hypothetical protein